MTERVIVVGDAGLDVIARHDGPLVAGSDRKTTVRTVSGGAGANTAAWLAALGADPTLVGRVGDDPAGRQVRVELTGSGVDCALAVDPVAATCCVVVLVAADGQRTMLSDRGAAALLRPGDLSPALLRTTRHLHLSGYVLADQTSRAAGLAMLAAAKTAGLTTSVDPATAAYVEDFLDLVTGIDLLLPNTDELVAMTGSRRPSAAGRLLRQVGAVAVTDGAHGATWIDADRVVTVPARAVDVIDSTGAGDAFDAATLLAWLAGATPDAVLRAGVAAGADAVGRVGARPVTSR